MSKATLRYSRELLTLNRVESLLVYGFLLLIVYLIQVHTASKRGWQKQWHHGKTELSQKVVLSVGQGIVAVQRDPLRIHDPLNIEEDGSSVDALERLKALLQCENLSWDQLPDVVEQKLLDTTQGKITWHRSGSSDQ
ncbi:MAG: hypothetical protein EAZ77_14955 [Nostocales cyanobacterium]|nr:MAG: hypothetical protein EAZ77_14955 [Nostocales cyanobacterium]